MQTEGMIADMVRNLQSDSATLRMLCARAIFRLAEEEDTRDLVRFNGGLDPLVEMLSDNTNQDDMVSISDMYLVGFFTRKQYWLEK